MFKMLMLYNFSYIYIYFLLRLFNIFEESRSVSLLSFYFRSCSYSLTQIIFYIAKQAVDQPLRQHSLVVASPTTGRLGFSFSRSMRALLDTKKLQRF